MDLKRISLWLAAGAVAAIALTMAVTAIVSDWGRSVQESNAIVADAGPLRQYHSADPDPDGQPTDHNRFSLEEVMSAGRGEPRPGGDSKLDAPDYDLRGSWQAGANVDNVVDDLEHRGCPYAIGDVKVNLRTADERIFGFGNFGLSTISCPGGEKDVVVYVTVRGTSEPPHVRLVFEDSQSGEEQFRFFGTARPEGILGQIRSPDGRLLLEHVALTSSDE